MDELVPTRRKGRNYWPFLLDGGQWRLAYEYYLTDLLQVLSSTINSFDMTPPAFPAIAPREGLDTSIPLRLGKSDEAPLKLMVSVECLNKSASPGSLELAAWLKETYSLLDTLPDVEGMPGTSPEYDEALKVLAPHFGQSWYEDIEGMGSGNDVRRIYKLQGWGEDPVLIVSLDPVFVLVTAAFLTAEDPEKVPFYTVLKTPEGYKLVNKTILNVLIRLMWRDDVRDALRDAWENCSEAENLS